MHRELKVKLAEEGKTLKGYVLGLIDRDLHANANEIDIQRARTLIKQLQLDVNTLSDVLKANNE